MFLLKKILLLAAIPAMLVLIIAILQISAIMVMEKKIINLKNADLIVVFPSENERVSAGLKLAEKGYGANLAVINTTSKRLGKLTEKHQIADEVHLLTGGRSRSTFEDVFRTSEIIREHNYRSLVLVTSSYHIPRSLFLLKTYLKISGMNLDIQHYPVHIEAHTTLKKIQLYYNETVKLWGSTAEMICYILTKTLPADIEGFNRTTRFLRNYLLFDVL